VRPSTFLLGSLLAVGAGACGLIAGLGDYASGLADSGIGVKVHPEESGVVDDAPTGTGGGDETPPVTTDDATDSAPGASEDVVEGEPAVVGSDAADAAQDAAAVCQTECGGCCDANNVCHGGQSVGTCGSGGKACVDCSTSGKMCGSSGTCVAASTMEAGPPPMCSLPNCKNSCPLLEAPCCKTDQTCGCAVLGLLLCN
jgi:hypothetical protein